MFDQKLKKEIKKIVFRYLDPSKDKIFVFGSRAIGDNRKFSDVDIGIESRRKISSDTVEDIKEAFEESNLPYTVDVVNFSSVTKRFKNVAKQKIIYLN